MTLKNPFKTIGSLGFAVPAAMPGLMFGYNLIQIIDNRHFQEYYIFANSQSDVILGTFLLGLLFGIFVAGYINHSTGRRIPLIASCFFGALALAASKVAPSFTVFLFSQLSVGFTAGIFIISSHIYICEIATPHKRVLSLLLIPSFLALGASLSLLSLHDSHVNLNVDPIIEIALLGTNLMLPCIMLIILPESPRFLAASGASDAALNVLCHIRNNMYTAARELADINSACRDEARDLDFFMMHVMSRRLLTFLCICAFFYNLSGANIIPYLVLAVLSRDLNCQAEGCTVEFSSTILVLTVIMLLMSTFVHAWALERFARRTVLIGSTIIGAISLIALLLVWNMPSSHLKGMLVLSSIASYLFFFMGAALSFLSVITMELLPTHSREIGITAVFLSNTIGLLFGLQTYQPNIHIFGFSGFFAVNAVMSVVLIILLYRHLPASYSCSLEELESRLISADSFKQLKTIGKVESR